MVYGSGLENRQGASLRGFESHPLRHVTATRFEQGVRRRHYNLPTLGPAILSRCNDRYRLGRGAVDFNTDADTNTNADAYSHSNTVAIFNFGFAVKDPGGSDIDRDGFNDDTATRSPAD